ncbi:hypothetical protein B879_04237 [Cecembia lonarensis LW9]|uniref:Uncharacterized protein n=1 Tax=Cecembia lonarensis (strain CCUG 58316 / KCTC 22772 / LW9) TaxID=1225176 RepID=K1KSN0_CECL9|nr:hypothetical protein B879_04237 [Cecembia lonarensis LW9]
MISSAWLPAASWALYVTIVTPKGKGSLNVRPSLLVPITTISVSQLSVAVATGNSINASQNEEDPLNSRSPG